MMQRMGMQVQQLDDVTKVIMESPTRRIVIDNPEVATVTVQGRPSTKSEVELCGRRA